jgi:hypothetical protein
VNTPEYIRLFYPNAKTRRQLIIVVKILVATLAAYLVFIEFNNRSLSTPNFPHPLGRYHIQLIILFGLGMVLNFLLDLSLWRRISSSTQHTSMSKAAFHHLRSITFGIITPYNVGEFGGKARQFTGAIEQVKAIYLTYVFRFVKMSARNITGAIALLWMVYTGKIPEIQTWQAYSILFVALGIIAMYFQMEKIIPLISGIVVLGRKFFLPLARITMKPSKKVFWLLLGIAKFFVYPTQFVLALLFFSSNAEPTIGLFAMVLIYYSVAAFLPSAQIIDPLVKGAAGILILSRVTDSPEAILLATTAVWGFNVALPAIIGTVLLFVRQKRT